ncbi:MAG: DUF4394 domain-containing protein [Gammaproteobacteria bacterium]
MTSLRSVVAIILSLALSSTAIAVPVFAVTESGYLIGFDSSEPNFAFDIGLINGLGDDETLIGIDFRPSNGLLYGATDGNNLYTLDTDTADAMLVGTLAPEFSGSRFGFDFNPVPDRLRITGDADQNLRCNPNNGFPACTVDGSLFYAPGDVNAGRNPNIVGSAYTNNVAGAATTSLYGIDSTRNTLVLQSPPNDGQLTTVGSLGVNTTDLVGFDILTVAGVNTAYASLTQNGSFLSRFYTIDLATGVASPVGGDEFTSLIGTSDQVRALAVATTTVVPLPATIGLLGTALAGLARVGRRQRRRTAARLA